MVQLPRLFNSLYNDDSPYRQDLKIVLKYAKRNRAESKRVLPSGTKKLP